MFLKYETETESITYIYKISYLNVFSCSLQVLYPKDAFNQHKLLYDKCSKWIKNLMTIRFDFLSGERARWNAHVSECNDQHQHRFVIWFLLSATVSWAVQCALTPDHLPVRPMSNANHTDLQCDANPAVSKLLPHSFTSPHRLHCGRKMCRNCDCNSYVASAPHYVTAGEFSVKTNMRQRLWITASWFIKQLSHWRI